MGVLYLNESEFDKALEYFEKLVSSHPNYFRGYLWKSKALYNLGNDINALECYNKALELNLNSYEAFLWRSIKLYRLKCYPLAVSFL